jgi:large subunit ribosomal protein L21
MATKTTAKKAAPKKAANKSSDASSAFAVIATGGKQYVVRVGDVVAIEKLDGEFSAGKTISFDQVLLTSNGTEATVGTPTISGAAVTAEFVSGGLDKKVLVVKYKAKSRYYKKRGHRQPFMKFKITSIA